MHFIRKIMIIHAVISCCAWTGIESDAATTDEYINNLQPVKGRARGIGGRVSIPALQKSPEVAIRLRFGINSVTLQPDAIEELNKLSKALGDESLRRYTYTLEGHTCDRGSADHNMELSKQRVYAVADYLTSNTTLSPKQFNINWYGESCPMGPNIDESARDRNRRVVIKNTLVEFNATQQGMPTDLQIITVENGQEEIVAGGNSLQSGTPFFITFKSEAEPYAYVCQIDSSGKAELLFPSPENLHHKNPINPGTIQRIPEAGELFALDNTTGTEQFVLVTHKKPVQEPILACKKAIQDNSIRRRGVGGIASVFTDKPTVIPADNNMQLCEIMSGRKTRGVGGIEKISRDIDRDNDSATLQNNSCHGYFLTRIFSHI